MTASRAKVHVRATRKDLGAPALPDCSIMRAQALEYAGRSPESNDSAAYSNQKSGLSVGPRVKFRA